MKSSLHWKIFSLADPMSDDVVADWTALAEESMEQNVFFFPWFVQASKQLFKNDYPDLVFFYEGDLLIGVLPVQEGRGFTRLPIFYLRPARFGKNMKSSSLWDFVTGWKILSPNMDFSCLSKCLAVHL